MNSGFFKLFLLMTAFLLSSCSSETPTGESKPVTPPPASEATSSSQPNKSNSGWFKDVTAASGVDFTYQTHITEQGHLAAAVGGGMAIFDVEGDGDLDLYFVQANDLSSATDKKPPTGNKLFLQTAPLKFVDATEQSGLGDLGHGMGVACADYDGDGDIDVYLCNFGKDALYRNNGDGTFTNVTVEAGIGVEGISISAGWIDFDQDSDLDLYITQYIEFNPETVCNDAAGRAEFCGPKAFPPSLDVFLENNGDGTFRDISKEVGIRESAAASLGVSVFDFDEDGRTDLYLANDAYENNLYRNVEKGGFVDEASLLGAALNMNGQAEAGMGVVAADLDRDGLADLFVTHLLMESNTFYRNLGAGIGFNDETGQARLASSSMAYTGFGLTAADIELDGDLDLLIANGKVTRGDNPFPCQTPEPLTEYSEPNLIYLNDGSGKFTLDDQVGGLLTDTVRVSRGLVHADLDRDGDLDMVVTHLHEPSQIFRNDAPRSGSWLTVRLEREGSDPVAEGASIQTSDGKVPLVRIHSACRGYASSFPHEVHFGAIDPGKQITVFWPGGIEEIFEIPEWNQHVTLKFGEGNKP